MNNNEIAESIIKAARLLGNGNASTDLGAIEALGMAQERGMDTIAASLDRVAYAIEKLAYAIEESKDDR
jgi:hypothetical protein